MGSMKVVKKNGQAEFVYKNEPEFLVQIILGIATITFWVISLFIYELFDVVELLLGLFMFSFAYNNYKNFKKKGITVICIVLGILFILSGVLL